MYYLKITGPGREHKLIESSDKEYLQRIKDLIVKAFAEMD